MELGSFEKEHNEEAPLAAGSRGGSLNKKKRKKANGHAFPSARARACIRGKSHIHDYAFSAATASAD
jgi:hypothetical protein